MFSKLITKEKIIIKATTSILYTSIKFDYIKNILKLD